MKQLNIVFARFHETVPLPNRKETPMLIFCYQSIPHNGNLNSQMLQGFTDDCMSAYRLLFLKDIQDVLYNNLMTPSKITLISSQHSSYINNVRRSTCLSIYLIATIEAYGIFFILLHSIFFLWAPSFIEISPLK